MRLEDTKHEKIEKLLKDSLCNLTTGYEHRFEFKENQHKIRAMINPLPKCEIILRTNN